MTIGENEMSESKHTQSKWSIERDSFGRINIIAPAPNGLTFVIAHDIGGEVRKDAQGRWTDQTEVEANSRLLWASPDLLSAAIETMQTMENIWRTKGRDDEYIYDEMGSDLAASYFVLRAAIAKAQGAA